MKWIVRADCRPPNEIDPAREQRVEPRRHRQAHQDRSAAAARRSRRGRRASAARCSASPLRPCGCRKRRWSRIDAPMRAPVLARRRQVRGQMAARRRVARRYSEAVDHEHPREEEVPAPRHRRATAGRESSSRTGTCSRLGRWQACLCMRAYPGEPVRDFETGGLAGVGRLAPVERGVFVENLQPAHQQSREGDDVDPVRDAHQQAVTVVEDSSVPWAWCGVRRTLSSLTRGQPTVRTAPGMISTGEKAFPGATLLVHSRGPAPP